MSWLDRYRQASFRNIEFYVPSHDYSGGRRNAIHELPGQDTPDIRDLGSKLKQFTIEAYVIGEDYDVQRNLLLDALDKGGIGKLVHPYLGNLRVSVQTYSMRENSTEMRMARFSLSFVQAGSQKFPTIEVDTAEKVQEGKTNSIEATQNDFLNLYDLTTSSYAVVQNVKTNIDSNIDRVLEYRKVVNSSAEFQKNIDYMKGNINTIAFSATSMSDYFTEIINFGTNIGSNEFDLNADNARVQYDELRNLWQSLESSPNTVLDESDQSIYMDKMIERVAVSSAGGLFSIMSFQSWDEAKEVQDTLFFKIQEILDDSDDDEVYESFIDLRSAIFKDFETRDFNLPRLVNYTPPITINTLFLSYHLYGRIDKEQEIIDRNKISNPAFVPGGNSMEVLYDVN